uniref:Capsid protein n=1 Tax=Dromedary picobirnavirus TaxID=1574421 RepID=A0A0A1ENX1_9VIRU|nr:capsid protein [Dromedary picobirnavirus]
MKGGILMSKNENKSKKGNKSYKGGKSNGKRNNYDTKDNRFTNKSKDSNLSDEIVGKENDPAWYLQDPQLVKDVTKIPFNAQVGRPIADASTSIVTPGICVLSTYTCPGIAKTSSDGVNLAGQKLFTKIRQNLSTYAPYAQADVTMYVLQINEIYKQYANILRMFGVVNLYNPHNLNYNRQILRALGLSDAAVTKFIANINDYRSRFNNLIYKASTLYLPDVFPIVRRHAWLFSNIFIDHNDPRAQIYLHVPGNFWTLRESTETGTSLIPNTPGIEEVWEYNDISILLDSFEREIDVFRNSDSMLKIGADMRHAFEKEAAWQLSYVPENYSILPIYSTEVLSQIENTIVTPGAPTTNLAITQDVMKNLTLYNPLWEDAKLKEKGQVYSGVHLYNNSIINMHWNNPSEGDIAVATRNMVAFKQNGDATNPGWELDGCGSDFVTSVKLWTYNAETGATRITNLCYNMVLADTSDTFVGEPYALTLTGLMDFVAFDWAPRIHVGDRATVSGLDHPVPKYNPPQVLVEFDNYTSIDRNLLRRIHDNVIMSMWSIKLF